MKKTNVLYWIFTSLFALAMIFTAIPNITMAPDSVKMIAGDLQYPEYLIPFLGWAKVFGVIGILIPGFPRIKEWAYAGLFFDLAGATYSSIAVEGPHPAHLGMLIFFGLGGLSYFFYHKRLRGE
jgi:hypothetical protein